MYKFLTTTALGLTLAFTGTVTQAQETADEATEAASFAEDYDLDTVVATVNGTDITMGHLIAIYDRLPPNYRQIPPEVLFSGLLDQLIDQQLLSEAAVANGAEDKRPVRIQIENDRRAALANDSVMRVLDAEVTEDDVQAAYEDITGEMTRTQEYNASHILVETEEEAIEIQGLLNDGADFAELAAERSTGPSGPNGGNLGWFGPGQMVPEFDAAVQTLEVGTISEPVETQFGWHVLTVNETRMSPLPSLEELRAEIEGQLNQDALAAEIEALRAGADIVLPDAQVPPNALDELDLTAD
ncbi:peptidylprolyl isomerase [Pontivivens insulae]|uniref:Parvulin-like PPIase n=1 Tax=Pontivivens insulae TaxID=1639689 RepID=A0A2R8A6Z3_9RHOB|nr:peptidylprolyl isomerase [Pontivivens insulae]RED18116.1 peptidyl-prolyl cis-trans isomerase C [Pontivivens insulae]SPF28013.1 putative parvulin-type peptidyl-prolyl cis-trans isomerase [Pontivivens insulae]